MGHDPTVSPGRNERADTRNESRGQTPAKKTSLCLDGVPLNGRPQGFPTIALAKVDGAGGRSNPTRSKVYKGLERAEPKYCLCEVTPQA